MRKILLSLRLNSHFLRLIASAAFLIILFNPTPIIAANEGKRSRADFDNNNEEKQTQQQQQMIGRQSPVAGGKRVRFADELVKGQSAAATGAVGKNGGGNGAQQQQNKTGNSRQQQKQEDVMQRIQEKATQMYLHEQAMARAQQRASSSRNRNGTSRSDNPIRPILESRMATKAQQKEANERIKQKHEQKIKLIPQEANERIKQKHESQIAIEEQQRKQQIKDIFKRKGKALIEKVVTTGEKLHHHHHHHHGQEKTKKKLIKVAALAALALKEADREEKEKKESDKKVNLKTNTAKNKGKEKEVDNAEKERVKEKAKAHKGFFAIVMHQIHRPAASPAHHHHHHQQKETDFTKLADIKDLKNLVWTSIVLVREKLSAKETPKHLWPIYLEFLGHTVGGAFAPFAFEYKEKNQIVHDFVHKMHKNTLPFLVGGYKQFWHERIGHAKLKKLESESHIVFSNLLA